ncbi:MAG: TerB family tellurite resistance protein [Rhodobacteraceae bacterium]|nr:TerB family tellurite resistance protein [Paracoccaceae bacterium]MCW9043697.1 TerB family tellurite resistance protein [Pseudopelagicola sp.]
MFENLIKRLTGTPSTPPLPEPDEHLALGALLVRIAKSDSHYHIQEISEIDHILQESFDLNAVEAAKMRATCEKLEAQAPGTPDFALLIRQNIDYAHRLSILPAFRRVVIADGVHVKAEADTVLEIEDMLGIQPEDRITL